MIPPQEEQDIGFTVNLKKSSVHVFEIPWDNAAHIGYADWGEHRDED